MIGVGMATWEPAAILVVNDSEEEVDLMEIFLGRRPPTHPTLAILL
jgi:hypothetical protein